jgi:small subunit ribosomal protein S6
VNDYEILLMLDPELPEERQGEILTRTQELITQNGGDWESQEPWGRRRLAYEIDHKSEGVYHLLTFRSSPETLGEVSRRLKITDGVMRHLATRRPKPHRRPTSTGTTAPPPAEVVVAAEPSEAAEGGEE